MSDLFYYRHMLGDYMRDTKELSTLEHGALRLLMDAYFANKGPISAAPAPLYRCAMAFTVEEQAAVHKVAAVYFVEADGRLHNAKFDAEIARVLKESTSQSAKARARWLKEADLAAGHAAASATGHAAAPAAAPAPAPAGAMPVDSHSQSQKPKKQKPPKPPVSVNLLPAWLPTVEWDAYLAMRQRKRKPATDRAIMLIIGELDALRMQGHPPALVLDQSTKESWTGVFPLKGHRITGRRANIEANNESTAAAWAGDDPQGGSHA